MNANAIKAAIEAQYPPLPEQTAHTFRDRKGEWINLDSPRSERILAHYASKPELKGLALQMAIDDLRGENV